MEFKLFGRLVRIMRAEAAPPLQGDSGWRAFLGGTSTPIDGNAALKMAAVFRCVDLLSKTMASLPLHMFIETDEGKKRATNHRLYNLVYALPNRYTTAYDFWQCFVANLLLTTGGYAKIERNGAGYITALWNIPTKNVVQRSTNTRTGERYIVVATDRGETETLYPGSYLYVPGFRFSDDTDPEDPIKMAAEVLGLTRDLNTFAHTTFEQGVNPGGFLEVPSGLSDNAYARLKDDFNRNYAGVRNSGRLMVLEEGMKANLLTRDLEKTQALESRKFAVEEICRIFGVPPHLCMDMDKATFSNIEQQSLEFVRDAVNPLSVRIEQAMFRDLLTESDRKHYFFKFNTNALLRGDTATRTQYYNAMRQNGVMSADDIRALEDMNELPDGLGKTVYINGNMLPLENAKMNAPKSAQKGTNA